MNFIKPLIALLIVSSFFSCKKVEPETEPENKVVDPPTFVINAASSITAEGAYISATVTGEEIKEVGFVYGSTASLNTNSTKTAIGVKTGNITKTFTSLTDNKKYYYAAYAINDDDKFFKSDEMNFTTDEIIRLKVGDSFEGGIIYEIDNSGIHGLLVSSADVTQGTNWQTAIDKYKDYTRQGNGQWRLPSKGDLEKLYAQKDNIGGFAGTPYWSISIEGANNSLAFGVYFGGVTNAGKTFRYTKTDVFLNYRAIRDF